MQAKITGQLNFFDLINMAYPVTLVIFIGPIQTSLKHNQKQVVYRGCHQVILVAVVSITLVIIMKYFCTLLALGLDNLKKKHDKIFKGFLGLNFVIKTKENHGKKWKFMTFLKALLY